MSGLWFLVEWVDERTVFSNYSVVNVSCLVGDDNEVHTGKIVLLRDRHSGMPRRGQLLRISETKRCLKEMKVMLERQDNQVKNVVSMCMSTMKDMKTRTMYSPQASLPQERGRVLDTTDSETDPEINPELNFTQSTIKFNAQQQTGPESFGNTQLIRTLQEKCVQRRRSLVSSTPLPPQHADNNILTFDQATQTDEYESPAEKIREMNIVVRHLYKKFLDLTAQVELKEAEAARRRREMYPEIEIVPIGEDINESIISNGAQEDNAIADGLKVRRASAQTTNAAGADGMPAEQNFDMVSIGSGNVVVPARLLEEIDWTSYTSATRQLLQAVFPRRVLATHSLTGKPSPAFADKPAKKCLDPNMVDDIVTLVSERCVVPKRVVRSCITTKCTDEAKLYRNRQMLKKIRQQQNQENVPPSPASSNECSNTAE
ncbi:unnamed protein product [Leptosia nina]|uniref:BEN domain-containing protein n=1 Tax=Leptosia nina TaxID=320188 RepID=A0AAV1K2A6_9NEOP